MNETAPKKKGRRFLGCLFKAPIGCLAFFVGALVVTILFLPPAVGRITSQALEETFAVKHMGSLEIGESWLGSVYGPQRMEGITLRDPEGREILRAELHAPRISFEEEAPFGPVLFRVAHAEIVRGVDGTTNLSRALQRREDASETDDGSEESFSWSKGEFDFQNDIEVPLELIVERLEWLDEASSERIRVTDFRAEGHWVLESDGVIAADFAGSGELEGSGGGSFEVSIELRRMEALIDRGVSMDMRFELELKNASTRLFDVVFAGAGWYGEALGERLDSLSLSASIEDRVCTVEDLEIAAEGLGVATSGRLRFVDDFLVGNAEDELRVEWWSSDSWFGDAALGFVPLVTDVELAVPDRATRLTARDFSLPLRPGAGGLRARLQGELGAATYLFGEELRSVLAPVGGERQRVQALALDVLVEDGVVRYERYSLPTKSGAAFIDGSFDTGTGRVLFDVEAPAGLVPFGILAVTLEGPREAPNVEAVEEP